MTGNKGQGDATETLSWIWLGDIADHRWHLTPHRKMSTVQFVLPDESKDLQVPSGLSMPSFMNCTEVFGLSSRLTPPTRAASHWPWRMAWKAFSKASKLEEQAVSMATLGPGEGEERKGEERKGNWISWLVDSSWLHYSSTNFSNGWTMLYINLIRAHI